MNAQAIQYIPSANLTLSIARKRFLRSFQQQKKQKTKFFDEKCNINSVKNEERNQNDQKLDQSITKIKV